MVDVARWLLAASAGLSISCTSWKPEFRSAVDCPSPDGAVTAQVYWVVNPGAFSSSYSRLTLVPTGTKTAPSSQTAYAFEASHVDALRAIWLTNSQLLLLLPSTAAVESLTAASRVSDRSVELTIERLGSGDPIAMGCGVPDGATLPGEMP